MAVANPAALTELGRIWKSWGGVWGGEFDDPIHFEFPGFPKQTATRVGSSGVARVVNRTIEQYANLPWYVQLFLPVKGIVGSNAPERAAADEIIAGFTGGGGIRGLFGP